MSKVSEYINQRMDELVGDEECAPIEDYCCKIVDEVKEKFKTQIKMHDCGGFNSPGYDIECYAVAFIDENGELNIMDFQSESY
jgi:hypothetical protein